MKRIRTDAFPVDNGPVLTRINLLGRGGFNPSEQVRVGVRNWGMEKPEFMDSIYFPKLAGYIETHTVGRHVSGADLADYDYDELGAGASEKGIRLM